MTTAGEAFFQDCLLRELAFDATADQPGIAVLNYLPELDPAAAADQLQARRNQVADRVALLADMPVEVSDLHPALDLGLRLAQVELEWLDDKLLELRKRSQAVA